MIFDYPDARLHRRHAPRGYSHYRKYRPWLRDEFSFRCVYCLKRETWGQVTGEFDVDHFQPQALDTEDVDVYENLVYACRHCNGVKSDEIIPDPFQVLTQARVFVTADGTLRPADEEAEKIIEILDLNSSRFLEWRTMWMRIVDLARKHDPDLLKQLVGFPADLPNLFTLRPHGGNDRLGGREES